MRVPLRNLFLTFFLMKTERSVFFFLVPGLLSRNFRADNHFIRWIGSRWPLMGFRFVPGPEWLPVSLFSEGPRPQATAAIQEMNGRKGARRRLVLFLFQYESGLAAKTAIYCAYGTWLNYSTTRCRCASPFPSLSFSPLPAGEFLLFYYTNNYRIRSRNLS